MSNKAKLKQVETRLNSFNPFNSSSTPKSKKPKDDQKERQTQDIEDRINLVEDDLLDEVDNLESNYSELKSKISEHIKSYQEQQNHHEASPLVKIEEIERSAMARIDEMSEDFKETANDLFSKLDNQLDQYESSFNAQHEEVYKAIEDVRSYLDRELPEINACIMSQTHDRNCIIDSIVSQVNSEFGKLYDILDEDIAKRDESEKTFESTLEDIKKRVYEEYEKERSARENFEENIFKLLEETCFKMSSYDEERD